MNQTAQSQDQIPYVDESCIGCRICANVAEHTFQMVNTAEDEKSIVTNPYGDSKEKIQEAIDTCPVVAIHWQNIAAAAKKDLRN